MTGDYFVVGNTGKQTGGVLVDQDFQDKPLTGLSALIHPFLGDYTSTGKRMTGANVRRRRQSWRRNQPCVGGITVATYDFWRAKT